MTTDHDILAKPLFSEDCDMAHRADQWSFPKGIARDAMVASDMDMRTLAEQYFEGAEAIIHLVLQNRVPGPANTTQPAPIPGMVDRDFEFPG